MQKPNLHIVGSEFKQMDDRNWRRLGRHQTKENSQVEVTNHLTATHFSRVQNTASGIHRIFHPHNARAEIFNKVTFFLRAFQTA